MTIAVESVEAVLAALGGSEKSVPWEALYGRIEAARAAGEAGFLVELLTRMYSARESAPQWSRAKHLALVMFRALATIPGEAAVRGLLARAHTADEPTVLAAALAQGQPLELLAGVASEVTGAAREIAAGWLHESVYWGAEPLAVPELARFAARLRAEGHPLGRVPLRLTGLEREMQRSGPRVSSRGYGSWGIGPMSWDQGRDPRPACAAVGREVKDAAWAATVAGIFVAPGVVCNARVEARRWVLAEAIDAAQLGAPLLRALQPDCVTGLLADDEDLTGAVDPAEAKVFARAASATEVLARLLSLAIGWRCYGKYTGVGTGRARAFAGLAALCELPAESEWEAIEAAARARSWALFRVEGRWFYQVCEDFGVMALDPSGRRVAIVAETDSD